MKSSIIQKKTFQFAIHIVRCSQELQAQNEFILSRQLLCSGTSIGANAREASQASSKKNFINKMNIALKEAVETQYWIELLAATNYLSEEQADQLNHDCTELYNIFTSIIKSAKKPIQ